MRPRAEMLRGNASGDEQPRTLVVVSHVVHYRHGGRLHAYAPYAREIDCWAVLFERILIAAPCKDATPPRDAMRFGCDNIDIVPQMQTGGERLGAKVLQLLALPCLIWSLVRAMCRGDAVLVRCPGNLGLLGAMLAPLCSRRLVAKYAGQWTAYPGEAWTVRLQRAILRSRWWHGPVLAYTQRTDLPSHVVPFFATVLTQCQLDAAGEIARQRRPHETLRILYVGRLTAAKNVHVLLMALDQVRRAGFSVTAVIVGDGPERHALEQQAECAGLRSHVHFRGAMEFECVLQCYEEADVLVLASESEGWPKAIAEAMAFGIVCIGSARGLTQSLLAQGRGLTVPPGDPDALANALEQIAAAPDAFGLTRLRAAEWAGQFSLERFSRALLELLQERWDVRLAAPPQRASAPCL